MFCCSSKSASAVSPGPVHKDKWSILLLDKAESRAFSELKKRGNDLFQRTYRVCDIENFEKAIKGRRFTEVVSNKKTTVSGRLFHVAIVLDWTTEDSKVNSAAQSIFDFQKTNLENPLPIWISKSAEEVLTEDLKLQVSHVFTHYSHSSFVSALERLKEEDVLHPTADNGLTPANKYRKRLRLRSIPTLTTTKISPDNLNSLAVNERDARQSACSPAKIPRTMPDFCIPLNRSGKIRRAPESRENASALSLDYTPQTEVQRFSYSSSMFNMSEVGTRTNSFTNRQSTELSSKSVEEYPSFTSEPCAPLSIDSSLSSIPQKKRILLLEDTLAIGKMACHHLQRFGEVYWVKTTHDAFEALCKRSFTCFDFTTKQHNRSEEDLKFDIALFDFEINGDKRTGRDLAKQLREYEKFIGVEIPQTILTFTTDYPDFSQKLKLEDRELFNGVMPKPASYQGIVDCFQEMGFHCL